MVDVLDTGNETTAQGSEQEQVQSPPEDKDKGKEKPFTPDQEAYIGSWLGRIVKKQIDESIVPLIKTNIERPNLNAGNPNDVLKRFNEELSEEIFTNPLGAIQKAVNAIEASKTQLTKTQTVQVDKAITTFSEEPLYKDIYQDMKTIARDAVAKGYPPEPAAEYAFAKAKAAYFEKKIGSDGGGGLDLADGGRPTRTAKTPKLPAEFKKAAARDIERGLFKNEQDYIDHLSPNIRAKYGF